MRAPHPFALGLILLGGRGLAGRRTGPSRRRRDQRAPHHGPGRDRRPGVFDVSLSSGGRLAHERVSLPLAPPARGVGRPRAGAAPRHVPPRSAVLESCPRLRARARTPGTGARPRLRPLAARPGARPPQGPSSVANHPVPGQKRPVIATGRFVSPVPWRPSIDRRRSGGRRGSGQTRECGDRRPPMTAMTAHDRLRPPMTAHGRPTSFRESISSRRSLLMDVVLLSRLQFALTIMFHYLFPPLTIGMGVVLVYLEGMYLRTQRPALRDRRALLDQDLRAQLRHRRRHRHRDGVRVRHELGGLLALRRRRLRLGAGRRGDLRVLPRVRLPRGARLRLGSRRADACTSSRR